MMNLYRALIFVSDGTHSLRFNLKFLYLNRGWVN